MTLAPQGVNCFALNCQVELFADVPYGTILTEAVFVDEIHRVFCFEHGRRYYEHRRELALAVQELHALALLYPDVRNQLREHHPIRCKIARAEFRVETLRNEERMFQGNVG